MISNLPFMAVHQEFQARHSDMLAAARRGEVVDPNKPQQRTEAEIVADAVRRFAHCRMLDAAEKRDWMGF